MKSLVTLLALAAALASVSLSAAEKPSEQQLIGILQSNANPQQKDAACAQLKRSGTAQCIPALASLLADEQLSHSARYALESMSAPEAGRALADALSKTAGLTRAGILASLGNRRQADTLPQVIPSLADADPVVAAAAAEALGKLGGPTAAQALKASLSNAPAPVRPSVVDALLTIANQQLASGEPAAAAAIYHPLYQPAEKDFIRTTAYRGLIRTGGAQSLSLLVDGIKKGDGPTQIAALQMIRDIADPGITKALTALIPSVPPTVQLALVEGLQQRGDAAAVPAILAAARSPELPVRTAAITALGVMGDASSVSLLAEASVANAESEQKSARQSLLQIRGAGVTDALLAQLTSAKPAIQVEIVRALAGRAETATVPRLLDLAATGSDSSRKAAYRAIGQLAGAPQIAPLVRLLAEASTEPARLDAQEALAAVCQRVRAREGRLDIAPIAQALASGTPQTRIALLPVAAMIPDPQFRAALRGSLKDESAEVRTAGLRALCDSRDPELLPDILAIARNAKDLPTLVVALQGCVRLVTEEESTLLSSSQRTATLKQILPLATRPEEKQLVLGGLAKIPDSEALQLILPYLDEPSIRAEAAQAATQVAGAIFGANAPAVSAAMKKVLAVTKDPNQRKAAEAVLKQVEATTGFVAAWQVAGPYRQDGKTFDALFDTAFAPETADAAQVKWKTLPAGSDPSRPWLMDILKALGGEQCVAYVRTSVYSDKEQSARLDLGSDDGVKVWVNGKSVYANNTARPITVNSDKVNITLKQGWNTIMLKITQNNLGWEYCARLAKPDGAPLEGLRVDPNQPTSL